VYCGGSEKIPYMEAKIEGNLIFLSLSSEMERVLSVLLWAK
jgi:hypothetical protein